MQDVLHNLVTKSMNNYIKFFKRFILMKTEVKRVNAVTNTYEPEEVVEEINTSLDLINADEIEKKTNINIIWKKLEEWVKIIKDTLEKFLTSWVSI